MKLLLWVFSLYHNNFIVFIFNNIKIYIETIPRLAHGFWETITHQRIIHKQETDKAILDEALSCLVKSNYFRGIDKYKNYMQMDWNALSTDPKEVYVLNKPEVLIPNNGKVVSIVLIPNVLGSHHRNLIVRVCPQVMGMTFNEDPNLRRVVDSKPMITKIPIEYDCAVPEIIWDNLIEIEKEIFIGDMYEFDMFFDNHDFIGGFFFYDVLVSKQCFF